MSVPIVQVKQGQLQGKFLNSYDGHIIYGYLGIPYAKTPVGNLRFRVSFVQIFMIKLICTIISANFSNLYSEI